jgi:hypothetical protein
VNPIRLDDVIDLETYERIRDEYRARMIEQKRPRRVSVGDKLTFVFEDRDTVLFQIQEMVRAERITQPDAVQAEIDVYNELIPREFELSATLMIEILEQPQIREELDRLVGIDEYVCMDVGDETVRATFDAKQFEEDRISAVQFVRFPLGDRLAARFRDLSVPVLLRVDHPGYRESTELRGVSRGSLAEDLAPES